LTITKEKVISITVLITFANVLAKVLGFAKDVLISYHYGASDITDAIFLAMSIPLLILGVFTSSTDSAIIPQYTRIASSFGRKVADNHFSNIVNMLSIIGIVVALLIVAFPNFFINIFAPGFTGAQRNYSIIFLRIFSFFGFMHILYCFFCAYNTIYNRVGARAVLSFTTNILVVGALLVNPDPQMRTLSAAYFMGNLLSGIIPIYSALKNNYKHRFSKIKINGETKKFMVIFAPIIGSALLVNLHVFVDKYLASKMAIGSISNINYASRLTSIFDNMIVVGLGVVILPLLSQSWVNKDYNKFNRISVQVIKLLSIILFPIMGLSMILAPQIVEVIYMRGQFDADSVNIVSKLFFWYSPQILLLPINIILAKIFHCIEDTKTPFYINIISVVTNIILSIALSFIWGIVGISVATSFSVLLGIILLLIKMYRHIGWDSAIFGYKEVCKLGICVLTSIIIGYVLSMHETSAIYKILIVGLSGGITYFVLFALLMPRDLSYLLSFICKGKRLK
jgi:putative peptidoglycan lipid II flippase